MDDQYDPEQPRGGNGRWTRTLAGAEKDAEAARLRSRGHTYQQIADIIGWANKGDAYHAVKRAMDAVIQEPGEEAVRWSMRRLDEERVRLHDLRDKAEQLLAGQHVTVSQGRVVRDEDGTPVPDDEFTLKVIDRLGRLDEQLRRNDESMRKLLGLDQPVKTQISGGVTYEVVGIDASQLQ